jgi:hypothetical protein
LKPQLIDWRFYVAAIRVAVLSRIFPVEPLHEARVIGISESVT